MSFEFVLLELGLPTTNFLVVRRLAAAFLPSAIFRGTRGFERKDRLWPSEKREQTPALQRTANHSAIRWGETPAGCRRYKMGYKTKQNAPTGAGAQFLTTTMLSQGKILSSQNLIFSKEFFSRFVFNHLENAKWCKNVEMAFFISEYWNFSISVSPPKIFWPALQLSFPPRVLISREFSRAPRLRVPALQQFLAAGAGVAQKTGSIAEVAAPVRSKFGTSPLPYFIHGFASARLRIALSHITRIRALPG